MEAAASPDSVETTCATVMRHLLRNKQYLNGCTMGWSVLWS
jgi:hypothetical protein